MKALELSVKSKHHQYNRQCVPLALHFQSFCSFLHLFLTKCTWTSLKEILQWAWVHTTCKPAHTCNSIHNTNKWQGMNLEVSFSMLNSPWRSRCKETLAKNLCRRNFCEFSRNIGIHKNVSLEHFALSKQHCLLSTVVPISKYRSCQRSSKKIMMWGLVSRKQCSS